MEVLRIMLVSAVHSLSRVFHISIHPLHCDIHGKKIDEHLAKEEFELPQKDRSTYFNEIKTIIKGKIGGMWKESHTAFNP